MHKGRALLVALACAAMGIFAPGAAAFHARIGAALGLMPPAGTDGAFTAKDVASGLLTPLVYHAGPVMNEGVTMHTIFWAPSGYSFGGQPSGASASYEQLIQQFFTDVAHDSGSPGTCTDTECNIFTLLGQYGDGTTPGGVHLGNYRISYSASADSIDDTDPYPSKSQQCASPANISTCITDGQVEAEVDHIVEGTPGTPRGLTNIWFVFLPANVDECIDSGQCGTNVFAAYHELSNVGHGATIYAVAIDPLIEDAIAPGSDPEGYPAAEAAIDASAHETMEAMTDPEGDAWMDPDGNEVADKCVDTAEDFGTPLGYASDGAPYNQVINGHQYLIQEIFADDTDTGQSGCVQASTDTSSALPLPQVNLDQFNSVVTGNVERTHGGGVGVQVSLVRADPNGSPVVVARGQTVTAANGGWSLSLAPHAPGDDRDVIEVDYSGPGAPQPAEQLILTGNGDDPFSEAGWLGWFDLDASSAARTGPSGPTLSVFPCFQTGILGYGLNGTPGTQSPTDFCNAQTDAATVRTPPLGRGSALTVTSNDNRAFSSPDGPLPNLTGGLVSLTVPVGEPNSVSGFVIQAGAGEPTFAPGGLPTCIADLELKAVQCFGLVPGEVYRLRVRRGEAIVAADGTGTVLAPLPVSRGASVTLSNGARVLTVLHVARLRVSIRGHSSALSGGTCQRGDYYGEPLINSPLSSQAGLLGASGGAALTGEICPLDGHAAGLPSSLIMQSDDRSGGLTETEVPRLIDSSPAPGAIVYGGFTAQAHSGLNMGGGLVAAADNTTRVSLEITNGRGKRFFSARKVDTGRGVPVPALAPGSYVAVWRLVDANGDVRTVKTRFVEERGRGGGVPRQTGRVVHMSIVAIMAALRKRR